IAHVTGHSLVLPNASRRGTIANRADAPMHHRTVRRALPGEVVLLHHALKTFAFRAPNHIHEIAGLKLRNAQVDFAFGKIVLQSKFAHKSLWLDPRFLELTEQRATHPRFFLLAKTNLHARITFGFFCQTAQQYIIPCRDDGHRTQSALGVVNAGHTNFLSKKSNAHDRAIANVSEPPPLKS